MFLDRAQSLSHQSNAFYILFWLLCYIDTHQYFERSLGGKIRLVDGTYWARHAKRLSNEIGLNEQCFGCSPCTSDDGRDSHSINTNTKKPSKIGAAAPVGVTQELHCKDDYKVPSQLDFNNNDNDGYDSNSGLDMCIA